MSLARPIIARSLWNRVEDAVPASSSKTVDEIDSSTTKHVEYKIYFSNSDFSLTKFVNFSGKKVDEDIKNTKWNFIPQNNSAQILDVLVDMTFNNTTENFELEVTNNEAFDIDVSMVRLII